MLHTQSPLSRWINSEGHLQSLSSGDVDVCRHHNQADGLLSFNELFNEIFYLLQQTKITDVEGIDFIPESSTLNTFWFKL